MLDMIHHVNDTVNDRYNVRIRYMYVQATRCSYAVVCAVLSLGLAGGVKARF